MEDLRACENCDYYVGMTSECRRYPKRMGESFFPRAEPDDWCGEFSLNDDVYDKAHREAYEEAKKDD